MVNFFWIIFFYYMAADLVSVGFAGYHVSDYVPYIRDTLEHPDQKISQWAGEGLSTDAVLLLVAFILSGPLCFLCISRIAIGLSGRFKWLCSRGSLAILTLALVIVVLGVVPALTLFRDRSLLDRMYSTLALPVGLKESLQDLTDYLAIQLETAQTESIVSGFSAVKHSGTLQIAQRRMSSANELYQGTELPDFTLDDSSETAAALPGVVLPRSREPRLLLPKIGPLSRLFSIDFDVDRLRGLPLGRRWSGSGPGRPVQDPSEDERVLVPHDVELAASEVLRAAVDPGPADPSAFVKGRKLPNVILIIFESFRHFAIGPDLMKGLDEWSEQGLRLQRHYSGSNCSHLGLFSLLYGRTPLGFHETLTRKIPPQLLESLRQSGYRITFLTSGEVSGFRRIDQFINDKFCDEVIHEGEFTLAGMSEWPNSDRQKLAHARRIVNSDRDEPQFVFFYLVSSHYRYPYPPEFEIYKESIGKESISLWGLLNPREQIRNHLNRYANSLHFLEHEVMNLVKSIDLNRNIVMITGDHGESMGEDGVFTHASRMSEIQLRVPFVMVGSGIAPRKISTATVHTDILPTLLHVLADRSVSVRNCQGRDLIANADPADEVVVVPANGPEWDGFMIIRGNKRMAFRPAKIPDISPLAEFTGLVDETGQYELRIRQIDGSRHALGTNR